MEAILEIRDLVKQYPGAATAAVKGVSLSIGRGEIFGLLGPNGAGKTTTISVLSCLATPDSGSVRLGGFDVVKQSMEVRKRIGLVPQDIALYPTLSARENLLFFGRMYGLSGATLRQRVDAALETVGLTSRGADAISTFSGGMKRRINIAAGLLHRPEVLFLDEPTVGVDPQSREFIFDTIRTLNGDGMTVLLTTHYMEEAQRLCNRVAIIDDGRIAAVDTPQALISKLGDDIIVLGVPPALPDSIVESIRTLEGVNGVQRGDLELRVVTPRAQRTLLDVLRVLNDADVALASLEIVRPNLETVFLHLTGRRLRD